MATHERLSSSLVHDGALAAWRVVAAKLDRHLAGVG
jgi:hypothetical protein